MVLVIDFGGQYNQLIARRIRECGVYCELVPYDYTIEQIKAKNPQAIVLTGGPSSVYEDNTPQADPKIFELGIPVLGICYGHQFTAFNLGGNVAHAQAGEYGKVNIKLDTTSALFDGIEAEATC